MIGDILDGSSLILAVLVAFYTIWQSDIATAKAKAPPDAANRAPFRRKVKIALWGRVVPLLGVATGTLILLAPRAIGIVCQATRCASGSAARADCGYDDVGALFLLSQALLIGLIIVLVVELRSLALRLAEVNARPKT